MALRLPDVTNYRTARFLPRCSPQARSSYIPITPRNKSVNVAPKESSVNNAPMLRVNSLYGHMHIVDYQLQESVNRIQASLVFGSDSDGFNFIPHNFYNMDYIRKTNLFIVDVNGKLKLNPQNTLKNKLTNKKQKAKGMFKTFIRWYNLRKDGATIPYDELKKITEPMVICYRGKSSDDGDKTRVLYPTGQCFVSYYRYLTNVTDFKAIEGNAQFSGSCFAERSKSLESTVEGMKMNDSNRCLIKKMYPYKGEKHKYFKEVEV